MKRIRLLTIVALLSALISPMSEVFAAQKDESLQKKEGQEEKIKLAKERLNAAFEDLEETELVLELPDGGIISGPGTFEISNANNPDVIIEEYSVQTDIKSVTVKEYKEIKLKSIVANENSNETIADLGISLRGPNIPTKIMTLKHNQEYTSAAFSGSGWRYGNYSFRAEFMTGIYLRWSTHGDTGNVCRDVTYAITCWPMDETDKNYWFPHWIQGVTNQLEGRGFYQTYNPKPGSSYKVANAD